jgi:integrase
VFGGRRSTTFIEKPWRMIRETAGLADVRLHDLRHAFASVAASAGMGLPIIGKMLGHTQAQTTQRYAHLASDPVKAAAATVAGKIATAMKGTVGRRKQGHPAPPSERLSGFSDDPQ